MKVKTWGTRGSVPISNPNSLKYGGNTTCLQIFSPCLPPDNILLIDAGSGIIPVDSTGVKNVLLLMTHHHHDHTQGLPLWGTIFNDKVPIHVVGPVQERCGPEEVFRLIMQRPVFPVSFDQVSSHFCFYPLNTPSSTVLILHRSGGFKVMRLPDFKRLTHKVQFEMGLADLNECLVIFMHQTVHPESTISYRFEERLTGKVFCLLTDHENQDGVPVTLRTHLAKADLLIQDTQYDRQTYDTRTSGWGHATPDYAVRLANLTGVRSLGLTHHDPRATDEKVEAILEEARRCASVEFQKNSLGLDPDLIFACADYMLIDV